MRPKARPADVSSVASVTGIGDAHDQSAAGLRRLGRELRTIPNLLSLSRVVLVYVSGAMFVAEQYLTALTLAVIAGGTDFLDGYLARRNGQVSDIGAILDRLSDLLFETSWMVLVTWRHIFSPVFLLLYLFREFVILSARLYCGERGVALPSSLMGKLKSNFFGYTAFAVYLALSNAIPGAQHGLLIAADVLMIFSLVLSYGSAAVYLRTFVRAYAQ